VANEWKGAGGRNVKGMRMVMPRSQGVDAGDVVNRMIRSKVDNWYEVNVVGVVVVVVAVVEEKFDMDE
jgi:hypothetical protein